MAIALRFQDAPSDARHALLPLALPNAMPPRPPPSIFSFSASTDAPPPSPAGAHHNMKPVLQDGAPAKETTAAETKTAALQCPRCESKDTKFCYYNNYSTAQPRHFCRTCRRHWTHGGTLRDVPVGGKCRRDGSKRRKIDDSSSSSSPPPPVVASSVDGYADVDGLSSGLPYFGEQVYSLLPELELGGMGGASSCFGDYLLTAGAGGAAWEGETQASTSSWKDIADLLSLELDRPVKKN